MRGADSFQEQLFTMKTLEDFVSVVHPLRPIRERVNRALVKLDGLFAQMYASDHRGGRPSIAPEKLLRAMVVQMLYSIRSERQLMEQVQYNLLYRWFIGLTMDDAVWVPTVFTKNRERLIAHDAVVALFNEILSLGTDKGYDAKEFVEKLQELNVAPHIAQNTTNRRSAVPDAVAQTAGYMASQQKRSSLSRAFAGRRMKSGRLTEDISAAC